jgi:hypothetical protein
MISFFWFIAGAISLWVFQWVSLIPFRRRHRVIDALIARAKAYQERGHKLRDAGHDELAKQAFDESLELCRQIRELNAKS